MSINHKKSNLQPSQSVHHLGLQVDLERGLLQVPTAKLKSVRKELGKFLTQSTMTCRKAAAILGQVRSFLTALPCLRAFTDLLVQFVDQHSSHGWDTKLPILTQVKDQVREMGTLLKSWEGRSFNHHSAVRKIHSDSSDQGWGAVDLTSGSKLQEFWRSEKGLHINIKELKAAISATKSLAKGGGNSFSVHRQSSSLQLLEKRRGEVTPLQQPDEALFKLVSFSKNYSHSKLAKVRRHVGR